MNMDNSILGIKIADDFDADEILDLVARLVKLKNLTPDRRIENQCSALLIHLAEKITDLNKKQ